MIATHSLLLYLAPQMSFLKFVCMPLYLAAERALPDGPAADAVAHLEANIERWAQVADAAQMHARAQVADAAQMHARAQVADAAQMHARAQVADAAQPALATAPTTSVLAAPHLNA